MVLDARGLGLQPIFSPNVYAPRDGLLYSAASLTPAAASARMPVTWTTDPADSAAS